MLPFRLVYDEGYDLHLGEHVFPSKKYKWLRDRLIRTRFAAPEDFVSRQRRWKISSWRTIPSGWSS